MRMHAHRPDVSMAADVSLPHGMCKKKYALTTWDKKQVPVCDPSLWDARPPLMKASAKGSPAATKRWTLANEAVYAAASADVVGWLVENQVR